MKYEIINIIQQYKDENIEAHDAMNALVSIVFPHKYTEKNYLIKLIAIMWDVEISDVTAHSPGKSPTNTFKPKVMYTKVLYDTYKSPTRVGQLCGNITHATVLYRIKQHDIMYDTDKEYKTIYDIVKKVI
jgi:hypothetical protein